MNQIAAIKIWTEAKNEDEDKISEDIQSGFVIEHIVGKQNKL